MTFADLMNEDISFEIQNNKRYRDEIEHFKQTAELYISFFSNSKRIHHDNSKVDYIHLIAVRIFQDIRAAFILTTKGLYPQSALLLRGVLESCYLVYDLKINPEYEELWFNGSKNKRNKLFKFSEVKKRVDEANVTKTRPIKGLYTLLSRFNVHINMESHLWYIETTNNSLIYHWAGYDSDKKSDALIHSCLDSLAQGLFIFTYEGFYAHNKTWFNDFSVWKKNHLFFVKKLAKSFDIKGYDELEIKKDKILNE